MAKSPESQHLVTPPSRSGGTPGRARGRENGLWHRPEQLGLLADLLQLAVGVALVLSLASWISTRPFFQMREVVVLTPPAQVTVDQLEYAARSTLNGNFFNVNLEQVRTAFEKLPWVRKAEVRRRWPAAIELRLEEHQAVAYWQSPETDELGLVNRQGEVFAAASDAPMPRFSAPKGYAAYVLFRHQQFVAALAPLGRAPQAVELSAREAWQLTLDDGLVLQLGREQAGISVDERLARFVRTWPHAQESIALEFAEVDLRYPGGYALKPATSAGNQKL